MGELNHINQIYYFVNPIYLNEVSLKNRNTSVYL